MNVNYKIIEIEKDSPFLDLGSFYSRYAGQFFYYQHRRNCGDFDDSPDDDSEYVFHLSKGDCKEVDENGKPIPILMCHLSKKGLPLPDEILREVRLNQNKINIRSIGYADFVLSVHPFKFGLTSSDEDLLLKLFSNNCFDEEGE